MFSRIFSLVFLASCWTVLCSRVAWGQGTAADVERARQWAGRQGNRVWKSHIEPHWAADSQSFWYRNDLADGEVEYIFVDAAAGKRQLAFDHARLAAGLAAATKSAVDPKKLQIEELRRVNSDQEMTFRYRDQRWVFDFATQAVRSREHVADHPRSFPWLGELRATRRTGDEMELVIRNRLAAPLRLEWVSPEGRSVPYGEVAPAQSRTQHTFAGHVWVVREPSGEPLAAWEASHSHREVTIDQAVEKAPRPRTERSMKRTRSPAGRAPDGKWEVIDRDHQVYLRPLPDGAERPITLDGTADSPYEPPFRWSPDSRFVVLTQVTKPIRRQLQLVESTPDDQLQPRLKTVDYVKPGDEIDRPSLRVYDLKEERLLDIPTDLTPNPWGIDDITWQQDSSGFLFVYNERGHQKMRVLRADAVTGAVSVVIEEASSTFIDYAGKYFFRYLPQSEQVLWMSERSGWCHLYRVEIGSGEIHPVTQGEWVVRGVERVDENEQRIWFRAGGIVPGQDPYYVHLARVGFDGSDRRVLTEGDGTHNWRFSPDGQYLIDTWSRVDQAPVTELRRADDGQRLGVLEEADCSSLLAAGWRPPERFVAPGRDGHTEIYGVIFRPIHFDPKRKYPVIEKIYAGPQGAFVPKRFGLYGQEQALAELGFILVQIDGMGTSYRSKAFHDVCWKNLKDGGFPDRIAWLKAAAAKYPEMDLSRVGIYGGSAGGQNALAALLFHGDFYRVGVADCGCHDNRLDKIWWNELWMGYPVGPHYAENSNVTHAAKLQGKLLLTVGELDTNVDPASTMQVVKALIAADKDFEFLVVPGAGHGAGELPYAARRRSDFFVRHLWGKEPRE